MSTCSCGHDINAPDCKIGYCKGHEASCFCLNVKGYVNCAGCGLDAMFAPSNTHGQTFCGYCKEYAQEHYIDLSEKLSLEAAFAMFHNVEGDDTL